jgi:hypothetical protein
VIKTNGALPSVALLAPSLRPRSRTSGPAYLPDGRLFLPSGPKGKPALPLYSRP